MSSARNTAKKTLATLGLLDPLKKVREIAKKGKTSTVAFLRKPRHVVNERLYRMPNPFMKMKLDATTPPKMRAPLEELRREGILILYKYIQGDRLRQMQEAFDRMVKEIKASPPAPQQLSPDGGSLHPRVKYREYSYEPELETTNTLDPFKYCHGFLEIALDEFVVGIIERYIGKRFVLQHAVASRYYPTTKREFGSWQWHHDAWGTKVNVMVLLTDVTEKDQYMSFMKRSHRLVHSYERTCINDRFTEEEVKQYPGLQRIDCICPAGSVLIFDSNGFHRGNRSTGAHRDSLICNFNAGRYVWPLTIPRTFIEGLSEYQRGILNQNPHIKYI